MARFWCNDVIPLQDHGPYSTQQNPSLTNAIRAFCNRKAAKVLGDIVGFVNYGTFLV